MTNDFNKNIEIEWREELAQYRWHPLFPYVEDVVSAYGLALYRVFSNKLNNMTEEEYNSRFNCSDFNDMISFLNDCVKGVYSSIYEHYSPLKALLDVFEPLNVNCYNGLALFKYKNYIELAELEEGLFEKDNEFWNRYNGLYRECRSVVIDIKNMKIVIAPQKKFHNVNEINGWMEEDVRQNINKCSIVEFSNKLDGSNQNCRYYNGEYILTGSSAIDPENSWRVTEGYKLLADNYKQMLKDNPDYTFMFEYISPKNIIVVNYTKEEEGLYLFGMRNVYTGVELSYSEVINIANKYGVKSTEIYNDTFDDILNKLDDYKSNEKEGWVINCIFGDGSNFKAKLKVNDYVLMHHALTKMVSPNAIIKAIADDKFDDFWAKIPVGHREAATETVMKVFRYVEDMEDSIYNYYTEAINCTNNKKDFMIYCTNNMPKKYRGYVISKYNNIPYNVLMKGTQGYKKLSELV